MGTADKDQVVAAEVIVSAWRDDEYRRALLADPPEYCGPPGSRCRRRPGNRTGGDAQHFACRDSGRRRVPRLRPSPPASRVAAAGGGPRGAPASEHT